jgi:hypothetical protein
MEVIQKCLAEKHTLSVQMLDETIKRLIPQIHHIRPEFQKRGFWYLLHDNAPAHSLSAVSEILAKREVPVLSHPPYSSDLALADFFFYFLT